METKLEQFGTDCQHQFEHTFHRFARLPGELWDEILAYALPTPRLIEVRSNTYYPYSRAGQFLEVSRTKLSPLLHACKESRCIALKALDLCFTLSPLQLTGCNPSSNAVSPIQESLVSLERGTSGMMFQPDLDTIYFRYSRGTMNGIKMAFTLAISMNNIKSVAIDENLYSLPAVWNALFKGRPEDGRPALLSGLRELIIITHVQKDLKGDNRLLAAEERAMKMWQERVERQMRDNSTISYHFTIQQMRRNILWEWEQRVRADQ